MKKSFIFGNLLLLIGSIILAGGIAGASFVSTATLPETGFHNYHFIGLGLGLALMIIGALILVLDWVINFTSDKVTVKNPCCCKESNACKEPAKEEKKVEEPKNVVVEPAKEESVKPVQTKTTTKAATPAKKTTTSKPAKKVETAKPEAKSKAPAKKTASKTTKTSKK